MLPRDRYSRIVTLDPGHGGSDPGAVRGTVHESNLNLIVARKLRDLLERYSDVRVYMTRDSDVFVGLVDRAALSNDVGGIFLSIHHNAATATSAHGIETYYLASSHDVGRSLTSRNFADILQRHLLARTGRSDRGVRTANFSVLRNSTNPAALVELGFMSNQSEFATLTRADYQWRAASAMFYAILEAFR